jgi:microcystin-dependent protein
MRKLILIIIAFLLMSTNSFADIPKTLNYQGRLMNTVGQPVNDGQYSVTFRLYAAVSGGTMVWEEAQSVASSNGYFNIVLGNTTALTPAIFLQPLWVGVQVGNVVEMTPRQKLGTAAYAMTVVDGSITAAKVASGWGMVPTGSIVMWPMNTPPEGWLECRGTTMTASAYPALFAAIGYTYGGSGDDFNLPNFCGYFVRGWDHTAGNDPDSSERMDRGDGMTGDQVGTKQLDEFGKHDHKQNYRTFDAGGGHPQAMIGVTGTDNRKTACYSAGGDETRPKNINMMYIIKK